MRLGILPPIAVAAALATTAEAQYIGFSITPDGSGTSCVEPPTSFPSIVTLYVVVNTFGLPGNGTMGVEFAIHGFDAGNPPAQPYFISWSPNPAANVHIGDPLGNGINMAFPSCQTGIALLGTLTIVNPGNTELRQLRITAAEPSHTQCLDSPSSILCDTGPNWTVVCVGGGSAYLNISRDPAPATDPHPVDGATRVPLQVALQWSIPPIQQETCEAGTISMDIYFGTDADPPYLDTTTGSREWPLPLLQPETTYYWRIVAGTHTSPVWSFTTGPLIGVEAATWGQVRGFYR